jgi:hypothetical protein
LQECQTRIIRTIRPGDPEARSAAIIYICHWRFRVRRVATIVHRRSPF